MKIPTFRKNSNALGITFSAAMLAGAGLSGCASGPYPGGPDYIPGYSQHYENSSYGPSSYGPTAYYGSSHYAPANYPYRPAPRYYYPGN